MDATHPLMDSGLLVPTKFIEAIIKWTILDAISNYCSLGHGKSANHKEMHTINNATTATKIL